MKKEGILLKDFEIVETKNNKVKIVFSIIVSTLIVATIATLLVGHLMFKWFKSDEYKIDAHINRTVYQANYFSEKKTINSKFTFNEHTEEKEYLVDNDFVVFLTEKKGNLNTAALVLLSSTATIDDEIHELPHLNMFDEEEIKDLEVNPNGAKYPMAVFKFDDDGKIEEIKLPNNMDQYNAESIIELINKVIPKLSRNKKEDISNGLEITSKKVNNKRTIIRTEAPKQFEELEGSRYTKIVKTVIENDQITNIESDNNLYMESQPEEDEIMYGPKDFSYNVKSEISSMEVKYNEKENIALVNKLAEKFTFIESEELLKIKKNKKEENKENKEAEEEPKQGRNLFPISASKSFTLATFDVLKQKVTVRYDVGVSSNKAYNKIVISSKLGFFEFGNTGCYGDVNWSKSYSQRIFTFIVPPPFSFIQLGCYVKGTISVGFGLKAGGGEGSKYWAKATGSLALGADIRVGLGSIASLGAFAEGTVISLTGQLTISNGSVSRDSGFKLSMGKIVVGIKGELFGIKKTLWKKTLYEGKTF